MGASPFFQAGRETKTRFARRRKVRLNSEGAG